MTILLTTLTATLMAILLYLVWGLDDWLGLLAFKHQYLVFSVLVATTFAGVWLAKSRGSSLTIGLIVFTLLVSPYFAGKPSSRILREVLIDVQPGTHEDEVVEIVQNAYRNSGYVMPGISRRDNRIHVSLLTQEPGDCTAAIFYLANGIVVNDEFSAD